jgi:hypothetical protein
MKNKYYFPLLFAYFFPLLTYGQVLLPFYENNRIGCVDTSGKIFIPAKFKGLGDFVNGLAPARIGGYYGFINTQGEFEIPDTYDYAEPFSEGFAKVWSGDRLLIINEKGKTQKQFKKYDFVEDFKEGLAVVHYKGKKGLVDKTGKEILKPIYKEISNFSEGYAVVMKQGKEEYLLEYAMVDKEGNFLIPFGKYSEIQSFKYGYAYVEYMVESQKKRSKKQTYQALIDKTGKEIAGITWSDSLHMVFTNERNYANEGLVIFSFSQKDPLIDNKTDYEGFANTKFEIVVKNPLYKKVSHFRYGKALVKFDYERLKGRPEECIGIIDKKGNLLNKYFDRSFRSYELATFDDNGLVIVSKNDLEGVIDTTGNFVIAPQFSKIISDDSNTGYFIITQSETTTEKFKNQLNVVSEIESDTIYSYFSGEYEPLITAHHKTHIDTIKGYLREKLVKEMKQKDYINDSIFRSRKINVESPKEYYGIIHKSGKWIAKPQFSFISPTKIPAIWYAQMDSTYGYINDRGAWIWKSNNQKMSSIDTLDIDYKSSASYVAYSFPILDDEEAKGNEEEGYNGWSRSSNMYQKINFQTIENKLEIKIQSNQLDTSNHYVASYQVYLSNTTQDTAWFSAQDSRIYMTLQAKNQKGKWVTIEDYQNSWCGNSYHTLFLPPNSFWNFSTPIFKGSLKTPFRLALEVKKDKESRKNKILYSNIFVGSINPAQFWRINRNYSDNLMNPY